MSSHHAVVAKGVAAHFGILQAFLGEEGGGFLSVGTVAFHQQMTAWAQVGGCFPGQSAIETERVCIRNEKGQMGFMAEYVLLHFRLLPLADIGRVAHDEVEMLLFGPWLQKVVTGKGNVGFQGAGIPGGHAECPFANVPCHDFGCRKCQFQTDRNAAAARSAVEQAKSGTIGRTLSSHLYGPCQEFLRFRPRDEHIGRHPKTMPRKPCNPQGILHRHSLCQTLTDICKAGSLIFRNLANFARINIGARQMHHFLHDQEGNGLCFARSVAGEQKVAQTLIIFIHIQTAYRLNRRLAPVAAFVPLGGMAGQA